ncbi:hypothetical protein RFI_13074 [Reticulomyxa filosa]|uniref:Uncharacterized protein n=1 Tax=Reticulomyxa filosa TaxID=46433 RepID=X6NEA9_RETFI|nr:hypothetical protein RFI_13074 [Reticulomyxa filosa]|eukprot:ETO24084.1 hypothetical protein RFI_13074 [Reticulomyxa filosa]
MPLASVKTEATRQRILARSLSVRVGVLWDKDKEYWQNVALEHQEKKRQREAEELANDNKEKVEEEEEEEEQDAKVSEMKAIELHKQYKADPHYTNFKPSQKKQNDSQSEFEHLLWREQEFADVLAQPLSRYTWALDGTFDVTITKPVSQTEGQFLLISDRVKKSSDFRLFLKKNNFLSYYSGNYSDKIGAVLRIEQWDTSRVDPRHICGDKVFTQWNFCHGFRFNCDEGTDIVFFERGPLFKMQNSFIRVGDRVQRSYNWDEKKYGKEDGEGEGTVVSLQFIPEITGILAKVRWQKNNHINLYSWGCNSVYDIVKVEY